MSAVSRSGGHSAPLHGSRTSVLNRLDREPFVALRKSYIEVCGGSHCAAALLSFFEYKANGSVATRGRVEPVQITRDALSHALLELFAARSIFDALKVLCSKGFIWKEKSRAGDTRGHLYMLCPDQVNDALAETRRLGSSADRLSGASPDPRANLHDQSTPGKSAQPPMQTCTATRANLPGKNKKVEERTQDPSVKAPVLGATQDTSTAGTVRRTPMIFCRTDGLCEECGCEIAWQQHDAGAIFCAKCRPPEDPAARQEALERVKTFFEYESLSPEDQLRRDGGDEIVRLLEKDQQPQKYRRRFAKKQRSSPTSEPTPANEIVRSTSLIKKTGGKA